MKIEWKEEKRKIKDLKDFNKNPRRISKEVFEKLVESIKQDGYHGRIMIYKDTILGGHQRKKALLKAGYKPSDEVAVLVPDRALSDDEFNRLNIRDNLPYGEFDFDILANEFDVDKLVEWGMPEDWLLGKDVENVGVSKSDDDVGEIPKEPKSKLGDVYILGDHRLMCGSATTITDVERLMCGNKADLFFTDPPYGVSYAEKNRSLNAICRGNRIQTPIENDHMSVNETGDLWLQSFSNAHIVSSEKASYYICGPQGGELMTMMMMIQKSGWQLKHCMIWAKNNHVLGRMDYHYKHEPIMYGWKDGESHNWYGDHSQTSLWEIDKPQKSELHPTMKPVELVLKAVVNSSKKGDIVLDLFGGSGTTLIACEKSARSCYIMELSPAYVDVIIERWEKMTGEKAVLQNKE